MTLSDRLEHWISLNKNHLHDFPTIRSSKAHELMIIATELAAENERLTFELEREKHEHELHMTMWGSDRDEMQKAVADRDDFIRDVLIDLWTGRFTPVVKRHDLFQARLDQLKKEESND